MSIQAVAWALDQDIPNSGLKLVLISLCNHADKDSWMCYPPRRLIEREASMSRSTARRHIKRLAELGIVEFSASYEGSGRQRANTYRIVTDPAEQEIIATRQTKFLNEAFDDGEGFKLGPSPSVDNDVENPGKNPQGGVQIEPPEGRTSEPPGGVNGEPPIKKPSEKPSEKPCSSPPGIDGLGRFIITPDRPEWAAWMSAVAPSVAAMHQRTGKFVTPRQWPDGREVARPKAED